MKVAPEYDFFKWVIHSDIGDVAGIKENAPDEAKRAFEEFMRDDPRDEYMYLNPGDDDGFSFAVNEEYFREDDAAEKYLESTRKVLAPDGSVIRYNFHPEGTTLLHVVSHDLGHMIERMLINRRYADPVDRVMMWRQNIFARWIYDEAKKELAESGELPSDLELRRGISECATVNMSETFAEAMVDYTANREKANPLSIKMIRVAGRKMKEFGGESDNSVSDPGRIPND